MLKTHNITYQYPKSKTIFFPDIHCGSGESLLILGNSGVGKSTLLHILGGLLPPTAGEVHIDDICMTDLQASALDTFRGEHIGIIFQQAHFIRSLNVLDNLRWTRKLAGKDQDDKRIIGILDRLGIPHKLKNMTDQLSQGEMQRLSIARALVTDPSIILADEPTSALDDENCRRVVEMLQEQSEIDKSALLIVTHDHRLSSEFENKIVLTEQNGI